VFKMYFPARNCVPVVSTATGKILQREAPSALGRLGFAGLASSSRRIHSFSRRHLGGDTAHLAFAIPSTRPRCAVPAAVSREHIGWVQMRGFSKADHTQVSGDNQKTEELLEKFEVQEGNQEARPQHTILHADEDDKENRPRIEADKWPERMTKGTATIIFL
jgi:hypothetical protein